MKAQMACTTSCRLRLKIGVESDGRQCKLREGDKAFKSAKTFPVFPAGLTIPQADQSCPSFLHRQSATCLVAFVLLESLKNDTAAASGLA